MIIEDNEIKEFTCFTCQKRFPLISDLTRHLTTEHKPDEALSLFAESKSLKNELAKEGLDCVNSDLVSASASMSASEERQISPRSRFFCSVCNRGFALKHHVVRHEEKIHNIVRPRMRQQNHLDSTPKTVVYVPNEVGGMTSHLQPLHQEPSISSTSDLTSSNLPSGPRSSRPRPHICEICAKGFTQRHHLKRHKDQAHKPKNCEDEDVSGESCLAVVPVTLSETDGVLVAKPDKPLHRCSSCYRGFTERHHMIRHEKTVHESKKDHHCILCGKHFSQKHHLLNHQIAIHCKTRNYSCSVCSKKFSLKHQLQRHEKRVHNTQILADGTVIKKRRQKREIGPDGKPKITWVGGEVIGFAGPPGEEGGDDDENDDGKTAEICGKAICDPIQGGNDDDSNHTNLDSNGLNVLNADHVGEAVSTSQHGINSNAAESCGGSGSGVKLDKIPAAVSPSIDEIPLLPAVEGEERTKVEALLMKLSNAKQMQATTFASTTMDSPTQSRNSTPSMIPLNSSNSGNHFSPLHPAHPPSHPARSTSSSSSSSAVLSASMKTSLASSNTNDSASTHSASTGRNGSPGNPPPPPPHLVNESHSPAISSPSSPFPHSSARPNPPTPRHQFLPHSLFASPASAGFQASPFFHMASNVISGLPPMDGVADANRKWAFLGESNAVSPGVGAATPNSAGISSQNLCNYQGTATNPTATQSSFLPPQSAHYPSTAYPISMTPHQTQQSILQFPHL